MKSIYIVLACSLISLTYNDIVVEESWRGVVSRSLFRLVARVVANVANEVDAAGVVAMVSIVRYVT